MDHNFPLMELEEVVGEVVHILQLLVLVGVDHKIQIMAQVEVVHIPL